MNHSQFSIYWYGMQGAVDWIKAYDEQGLPQFFEDFSDRNNTALINPGFFCPPSTTNCNTALTNFFNLETGKTYSYSQIDSIYQARTGKSLQFCDVLGSDPYKPTLCGRATPPFSAVWTEPIDNCSDSTLFIQSQAQTLYQYYRDSLKGNFDLLYKAKCLEAYKFEKFTVVDTASEYHYTLYYYDQAGNLVKTVPPAGVRPNRDSVWLESIKVARANRQFKTPDHVLITNYRYNALNQVVAQKSPDGGMSQFWYDRLGRLVISQNARQRTISDIEENRLYSYTKYDELGRIAEVGQLKNLASNGMMVDSVSRNLSRFSAWMTALNNRREQITSTVYDLPYPGFVNVVDNSQLIVQRNLRNRVSYTTYTDGWNASNYNSGTFYTYDIHGNVDTLLQDFGCGNCGLSTVYNLMNQNGNRFKKISYKYDLISGKVNSVSYQKGWSDQFFHRYSYDGENRLTLVETSLDGFSWEKDARYEYYLHGPLARTVLGHQQVQGIDYAYTLQGWLKGVNSSGATSMFDMGRDGNIGVDSLNRYIARDAFGFALNYFGEDYKPARAGVVPFPAYSAYLNADFRPLYNGNISSMVSTNRLFSNPAIHPDSATLFFNYSYDQLNRITGMDVFNKFNRDLNNFTQLTKLEKYKERVSYDPNGNTLKYLRNNNGNGNVAHLRMDSLTYAYYAGTNQLRRVRDSVPSNWYGAATNDKIIDIDNQTDEDNYIYDSIGNLIRDKAENITNINWNVYGKITGISRGAGIQVPASEIHYTYDAAGNRISKTVEKNGRKYITWYVRDAQGNVMATYTGDTTAVTPLDGFVLNATERYIYGSSRLGVTNVSTEVDNGNGGPEGILVDTGGTFRRGERVYELSNHLGNVLVTISDRKKGIADPLNAALIKFFEPVMLSGTDYYPFGMAMRLAMSNAEWDVNYRFGYNKAESDHEISGWLNNVNTHFRELDTRVGRWWSIDPVTDPATSPYSSMSNNPVLNTDPDGDCATCPKNAKFGAKHSEKDVAGATPLGGHVFAGSGATLNYVNIGDEKNPNWVIGSFQNKAGEVFSWNNEKKWYSDSKGGGYDQSWYHDITDWGSKQFGKPMSQAAKNAFDGEPLKDTRAAYGEYKSHGGSLGIPGFIATGAKAGLLTWWDDLNAWGHRGSQAMISFWHFTASAGVPSEGLPNLPRLLTTSDGYLFGSVTVRVPFTMKVQRFGAMSLNKLDYWGPTTFGSSKWAARSFNAILPEWNNLSVYTTGVIPKGTKVKLGITGPQGWRFPGGLFQFQVESRRVINQTSKIVSGNR